MYGGAGGRARPQAQERHHTDNATAKRKPKGQSDVGQDSAALRHQRCGPSALRRWERRPAAVAHRGWWVGVVRGGAPPLFFDGDSRQKTGGEPDAT